MTEGYPRLETQIKTVEAMIGIYCRDHHGRTKKKGLCNECGALAEYARKRVAHCVYQQEKPTCGRCPIHCYKMDMRQKIQEVMRYAGPRMVWRHPLLAMIHLRDSRRKPPPRPPKPTVTTSG